MSGNACTKGSTMGKISKSQHFMSILYCLKKFGKAIFFNFVNSVLTRLVKKVDPVLLLALGRNLDLPSVTPSVRMKY